MKKRIGLLLFLTAGVSLHSCYSPRYVYSPVTQNIPQIHNKNDWEVAGSYSGSLPVFEEKGNYNSGFDIHTAWAFSKHFAVTVNRSFHWEKNGNNDTFYPGDTSLLSYKRNFSEMGIGYFASPLYNPKMQFQLFAGVAVGKSNIFDDYFSGNTQVRKYHESNVTKLYLQPAVNFTPSKYVSAALSSRFTAVIFTHIHSNYSPTELANYLLDSLTVSPVFFWEPGFTLTVGFKKMPVKIQAQGSLAVLLNHRFVEHRTGNFGLGIVADFSKKKIKSNPPGN